MTKARVVQIDPQLEPKEYRALDSLAIQLLRLAESVTKCAEEYELVDMRISMEKEV
jgi:hypothetical protein